MTIGFNEPLYILPFDHRGSFQTKMFGWTGTLRPAHLRGCWRKFCRTWTRYWS